MEKTQIIETCNQMIDLKKLILKAYEDIADKRPALIRRFNEDIDALKKSIGYLNGKEIEDCEKVIASLNGMLQRNENHIIEEDFAISPELKERLDRTLTNENQVLEEIIREISNVKHKT